MDLRVLIAVLLMYQSNAKILHWKSCGPEFDTMHKDIASDLYSKITNDIDTVAEMALRLDINPPNYAECIAELRKYDDYEFKLLNTDIDYPYDEFTANIGVILDDILYAIEETLFSDIIQNEHKNVGIKSSLEALYESYDIQARYLNKRRNCDHTSIDTGEIEVPEIDDIPSENDDDNDD